MVHGDSVVMEDDALNQHECMASLVGLLNHMKTNNITPQVIQVRKYLVDTLMFIVIILIDWLVN